VLSALLLFFLFVNLLSFRKSTRGSTARQLKTAVCWDMDFVPFFAATATIFFLVEFYLVLFITTALWSRGGSAVTRVSHRLTLGGGQRTSTSHPPRLTNFWWRFVAIVL